MAFEFPIRLTDHCFHHPGYKHEASGAGMELLDKQAFIRRKARENRDNADGSQVYWSRHAITEMVQDQLTRSEVETALQDCEVIEDYPVTHRPLPDCLVLGQLPSTPPIHAVIAIDQARDRIFVVTVYRPSAERWEDDWRTRK